MIDISIMPSLECDLLCSFCMYDAGPDKKDRLDIEKTRSFIATWDWDQINQVGFYGGEPSINLPLYQSFVNLIPQHVSKFLITNGAWSTDNRKTRGFLNFLSENGLFLVVSGTEEHRRYQNRAVLINIGNLRPDHVRLKGGDVIHKMGRGVHYEGAVASCSGFCQEDSRPTRLAIMPNGNVVYQNCHGDYPFVQTIDESFVGIEDRIKEAIKKCKTVHDWNRRKKDV